MSPVNTLLSLWKAIITSYSRGPLNPKVTSAHVSVTTPLPCVFFPSYQPGGHVFEAAVMGDLGFAHANHSANFLFISPRHSQGLLLH